MSLEVEGTENELQPSGNNGKPTEVGNKVKKNRVTNGKEGNIILRVSAGTGKLPVGGEFYGRVLKINPWRMKRSICGKRRHIMVHTCRRTLC